MNGDTSSSATSQYHAQLYSGQKQLQKRLQQQAQGNTIKQVTKPTSLNYNIFSFEPPNLYETSLKLTTETEIHAWWDSLVKIFSGTSFHATRITLSIPQDPNDPFMGPWGLKAVYNKTGSISQEFDYEDALEDDYFLHSRAIHETGPHHIPWCFDRLQPFESEPEPLINNPSVMRILKRNSVVVLSREYRRKSSGKNSNDDFGLEFFKRTLLDSTSDKSRKSNWSIPIITTPCFSKDEASEILVDGSCLSDEGASHRKDSNHSIIDPPLSTTSTPATVSSNFLQDFDEYEQQQPSPWSQSPAPSPAIMDSELNPFFTSPPDIDDEAFNPASPESYDNVSVPFPPPLSNMHSVVHIPLFHPSDVMNRHLHHTLSSSYCSSSPSTAANNNKHHHHRYSQQNHLTPIAILSFLTPIVPYPPVLLSSINSLSPFIAASFANAIQNAEMKKHGHFYTRRNSSSRHKYTSEEELSKRCSSVISNTEDDEQQSQHRIDSTNTTPTAALIDTTPPNTHDFIHPKRPDHFGSMSNFTHSSLETVTEQLLNPPLSPSTIQQKDINETTSSGMDLKSNLDKENKIAADTTDLTDRIPQTDHVDNSNLSHHLQSSHKSFSPSSAAIMEGWGAVSPTTGLPISASIPPHTMCSNKNCQHRIYSSSSADDHVVPKATTSEENSLLSSLTQPDSDSISNINPRPSAFKSPSSSKSIQKRHVMNSHKKKMKKRKRYSNKRQDFDDDGFHYHRETRTGVDRFLVAPKSSLLRLIIDGIPIHVFTLSTTTGKVTWVNNRTLQYTGKSLRDHLGPNWLSHMHPDDQPECKKAWELAYEQGNGFAGEYRLKRFDGVYRCFLWRIVPLRDLKGIIIHWFGTCTDIHDQHMAKESNLRQVEIESNERKYRLLAEAIPQIVFTFSPGAGLTYTNGKWSKYSGKSFDQTMGLGFMSCVHPDDRSKLQLPDLSSLSTNRAGISWQNEIRLSSAKEEYKWFLVKCVSVDELDTGDIRWFGTCTDINDHKLLEQKLKEAHDAAQKSTESKTRFLSNMSHEIRTPLIGITGMLNFLLDTELTPEQMDYVHTIQQSAESLLVVINDILDLSKVEAGMMNLEWEPFSLVTMIEDANELLSTLAIQKNLELSFWVNDDIPDVVIGDRIRLRQVLLNLIGNAIKFTSEGEVFTRCTIKKNDIEESELTLLFEVIDTGTGFDAADESVMFKPFSQVDSSSTRKHGGSGLGLVISRQLIELHGGVMKCRSQKGKGSTFYFTVKFGIPTSQTRPLPQTPQNETNHDPFFRTNGYENNSIAHDKLSYVNKTYNNNTNNNNNQPTKARSIPTITTTTATTSDVSQAEILQDVLMNKAANMQLKPPPVRNNHHLVTPAVAAAAAAAATTTTTTATATATTSLGNDILLSSMSSRKENKSELSTQSTCDPCHTKVNSDHIFSFATTQNHVILPPRTPTRTSPLRALVVSQWKYSRESMENHVKSILSSIASQEEETPYYEIDTVTNQIEATERLTDPQTAPYDYIMINLSSEQQILILTRTICGSLHQQKASVLIMTTPMQRSSITEMAKSQESQVIPQNCGFIFKPLKRNKLRWYFGIRQQQKSSSSTNDKGTTTTNNNERTIEGTSTVSTPDTPCKRAATQKEIFRRMADDVGGKGYRVLLVEDNLVNQKVLTRYLTRVGLTVDVAVHGGKCIELFHKHPKDYYCLILCDLFMPVKDGYETTREIREWEKEHLGPEETPIPIVALSANVMSNVANKCLECGFSTYISKPVNFAILSDVIRGYLLKE